MSLCPSTPRPEPAAVRVRKKPRSRERGFSVLARSPWLGATEPMHGDASERPIGAILGTARAVPSSRETISGRVSRDGFPDPGPTPAAEIVAGCRRRHHECHCRRRCQCALRNGPRHRHHRRVGITILDRGHRHSPASAASGRQASRPAAGQRNPGTADKPAVPLTPNARLRRRSSKFRRRHGRTAARSVCRRPR